MFASYEYEGERKIECTRRSFLLWQPLHFTTVACWSHFFMFVTFIRSTRHRSFVLIIFLQLCKPASARHLAGNVTSYRPVDSLGHDRSSRVDKWRPTIWMPAKQLFSGGGQVVNARVHRTKIRLTATWDSGVVCYRMLSAASYSV